MKLLLPLLIFAFPLALLAADELPTEVPRPAIDTYRHVPQPPYIAKPEGINGMYRKLTITPKTLPDPLLRYRVNIFAAEQETGNAYPLYLAALKTFTTQYQATQESVFRSEAYRKHDPGNEEEREAMEQLRFKAFPLYSHLGNFRTQITPEEETQLYTRTLAGVYPLLEKASKKTYVDWSDQYEFRGIATMLEPLQEWRTLARYLVDKANWEIRNGRYDDALRTIRVGLALSDHVLESKPSSFLVGMMVGVAIKGMMYESLFLLAAQPDAPNLYPALMQLRLNEKTWNNAIQSETLFLLNSRYCDDNFWNTLDSLTPEQAKTILAEDFVRLFLGSMGSNPANEEAIALYLTAVCLAAYQPAKQRLLQKGLSEEEIEALSTFQIVVPFALEGVKRTYDVMLVEASMPVGETPSAFKFDEYVHNSARNPTNYPADMMMSLLAPATTAARTAFARQQQTLDLLKIVEAIRYYTAIHGKLPESLEAITELAVPKMCPITAKPYQYRTSGNTAVIDYSIHSRDTSRIEIVLE